MSTQTESRDYLLSILKPGDTVYTRVNHVARSGMMRVIDLYVIRENEPLRITWHVCNVLGSTYNRKHEGLRMDGCGMDMCFAAVYELGSCLWREGTSEPHSTRNGQPDRTGGHALTKRDL